METNGIEVVSAVLPFRANRYVMEQLIDWDAAPDDPIFRLTFPHADMLDAEDYTRVRDLLKAGDKAELDTAVNEIRFKLNPHPVAVSLGRARREEEGLGTRWR